MLLETCLSHQHAKPEIDRQTDRQTKETVESDEEGVKRALAVLLGIMLVTSARQTGDRQADRQTNRQTKEREKSDEEGNRNKLAYCTGEATAGTKNKTGRQTRQVVAFLPSSHGHHRLVPPNFSQLTVEELQAKIRKKTEDTRKGATREGTRQRVCGIRPGKERQHEHDTRGSIALRIWKVWLSKS